MAKRVRQVFEAIALALFITILPRLMEAVLGKALSVVVLIVILLVFLAWLFTRRAE